MSDYRHIVRKWVKPEDLNQHDALFGGRLLQWVDEEAAIVAVTQLGSTDIVTRHMSAIDFVSRAGRGDLLELEYSVVAFGRTSITLSCRVGERRHGAGRAAPRHDRVRCRRRGGAPDRARQDRADSRH